MTAGSPRLVAVVGMVSEARLLDGAGLTVIVGGGQAGSLAARLDEELRTGAVSVLSFGLCGALDPTLEVGDCVVASAIVTNGQRIPADPAWARQLMSGVRGARLAEMTAGDGMVASAAAKAELHRRTGAVAVDMESHIVGRLARHHGLPFAALRVVSDAAHRALPKAAQAGLRPDGKPDIVAVLKSLMADPRQLPDLIRTGREAGAALRALVKARHGPGPWVGCPYLGETLTEAA
jgi:hopanoid-associated phosphorylase